MKKLLFFLTLGIVECLSASSNQRVTFTVHIPAQQTGSLKKSPTLQSPDTITPPKRFCHKHTFHDDSKKYKRAFLHRDPEQLRKLNQQGCPKNTSIQRQKAVLAILARTQQETLKKELFTTGLDAGLFTQQTALQLGAAMQWQGRQLVALAQQQKTNTQRKVTIHNAAHNNGKKH